MSTLLSVRDLVAGYGKLPILHGVSLAVAAGEIVTLIGPNGSGKSTLLKAIFGQANVLAGQVLLAGTDISRQPGEDTARAGRGYVPQPAHVLPALALLQDTQLRTHA